MQIVFKHRTFEKGRFFAATSNAICRFRGHLNHGRCDSRHILRTFAYALRRFTRLARSLVQQEGCSG